MSINPLHARQPVTTAFDLNRRDSMSVRIRPSAHPHAAACAVEEALRREDIDDICGSIRNFIQVLHLSGKFQSLESYLRHQWDESQDRCTNAVRNACISRP